MSNWREMSAGRDLDKIVAKRLGHVDPTNGEYLVPKFAAGWEFCPYYSTDANAALALWTDDPKWSVFPDPDQPGKFCGVCPGLLEYDAGIETGDSPAHAIVKSWLLWGDTYPAELARVNNST